MKPRARYDGFADWYDANIGPFAEPAGRELLELLGPGPGRLLDLACGGGINLRRLTDAGWSVTGVDLSADQLRLARQRAPAGVELLQADATALPFADASFDAIACALLHTDVADFAAVCREAGRVLKPGGRLAYVGIHPCFVGRSRATRPANRRSCIRDIGTRAGRPRASVMASGVAPAPGTCRWRSC